MSRSVSIRDPGGGGAEASQEQWGLQQGRGDNTKLLLNCSLEERWRRGGAAASAASEKTQF